MGALINIKNKILNRKSVIESEEQIKNDLVHHNKDKLETDISQRRGLTVCSGLSTAERDYILSDAVISSAIQLYLADISTICSKDKYRVISNIKSDDPESEVNKKLARINYILNLIFSDSLIDAIALNLLVNGEIFLDTKYNEGLNKISVVETSYTRCTQLLFSSGDVAGYIVSNLPFQTATDYNSYSYSLSDSAQNAEFTEACEMVRIYNPTLVNSKICVELDESNCEDNEVIKEIFGNKKYLYYTNSQSLLKQVYPDWLNSKLLELAVYRDRIAKSRFIQLIALELGRTSKVTTDQIYDNVKDYFDKRAVIDLEQQTFKSVVGNEPFTDYKVYITRNGIGQLSFDNSLNGTDANVSSLADLEYNQAKVYAGLGIPKQYLGADDNGSALSNGGSLFFMDEKYQKRVVSYVKRIANGLKDSIKNIILQQEKDNKEFFHNFDFDIVFEIPESNEDVYRVKNAKVDYVNAILDLVDKIRENEEKGTPYSITAIGSALDEDISKFMTLEESEDNNGEENR